jgi:hypothetical protein
MEKQVIENFPFKSAMSMTHCKLEVYPKINTVIAYHTKTGISPMNFAEQIACKAAKMFDIPFSKLVYIDYVSKGVYESIVEERATFLNFKIIGRGDKVVFSNAQFVHFNPQTLNDFLEGTVKFNVKHTMRLSYYITRLKIFFSL